MDNQFFFKSIYQFVPCQDLDDRPPNFSYSSSSSAFFRFCFVIFSWIWANIMDEEKKWRESVFQSRTEESQSKMQNSRNNRVQSWRIFDEGSCLFWPNIRTTRWRIRISSVTIDISHRKTIEENALQRIFSFVKRSSFLFLFDFPPFLSYVERLQRHGVSVW